MKRKTVFESSQNDSHGNAVNRSTDGSGEKYHAGNHLVGWQRRALHAKQHRGSTARRRDEGTNARSRKERINIAKF